MPAPIIPVVDQATILNSLASQAMGSSVVVDSDLSNLVDIGKDFDALSSQQRAAVTGQLVTLVTEQLVVAKEFKGTAPDIIRSRETSGYDTSQGIIQKIRPVMPQAVNDSEAYDPTPGTSSDPFKNIGLNFETEYFSKPISARYEWSQPERWLTGAFLTRDAFGNLISAVNTAVSNAIVTNVDAVTYSQLRASIGLNLRGAGVTGGPRAFNLLAEFNEGPGAANPVTVANCLASPEFLRYAVHRIFIVMDYLRVASKLYNEKNYPNQITSDEDLNVIFLSQFRRAAQQFMLSDVYNEEYLRLPANATVASWKGLIDSTSSSPSFLATSTVKDTFDFSGIGGSAASKVNQTGVLAHIFDSERIGIYNLSTKTTSQYDPVGLKTNFFTHVWGRGIVDPYEHGVTFYVADAPTP